MPAFTILRGSSDDTAVKLNDLNWTFVVPQAVFRACVTVVSNAQSVVDDSAAPQFGTYRIAVRDGDGEPWFVVLPPRDSTLAFKQWRAQLSFSPSAVEALDSVLRRIPKRISRISEDGASRRILRG